MDPCESKQNVHLIENLLDSLREWVHSSEKHSDVPTPEGEAMVEPNDMVEEYEP